MNQPRQAHPDQLSHGLVHAFVLDGQGGGRPLRHAELEKVQLQEGESLWLHLDRSHPRAQRWLREQSGLSEFACELLLEENTRPRLVSLPDEELLIFLRGLNLNPGADPEDMVSLRIFAAARQVISLRLRSARATDDVVTRLEQGNGPRTTSELLLELAEALTERIESVVIELAELVDLQEEGIDRDPLFPIDQQRMLQIRRRAAGLRRFLSPQREICAQLARPRQPWIAEADASYWGELHNRLTRHLEELELTRERVGLVLETESRRLDARMNRIMYRFGIITCIFLPISFLTSLLGINVGGIPGATSPRGFAIACGLILLVAIGQLWLFRRLRWL